MLVYQMRNVAYNAVCLFDEGIQVLDAQDMGRNGASIVGRQHLVEDGGNVHGCRRRDRMALSLTRHGGPETRDERHETRDERLEARG